jgi:hypothetical protein
MPEMTSLHPPADRVHELRRAYHHNALTRLSPLRPFECVGVDQELRWIANTEKGVVPMSGRHLGATSKRWVLLQQDDHHYRREATEYHL